MVHSGSATERNAHPIDGQNIDGQLPAQVELAILEDRGLNLRLADVLKNEREK